LLIITARLTFALKLDRMTEKLLQYIWQYQYFNKNELITDGLDPQPVQIISPGTFNTDQGPDFCGGQIRIGDTVWVGSIELHVRASEWAKHKHQADPNYQGVILHVVWENDFPPGEYAPPLVSLAPRVSKLLLKQYEDWMMSPSFIPCGTQITNVTELVWTNWKERLLIGRLQKKTSTVFEYLEKTKNHWEEVLCWMLAQNFGITVNREAFGLVAQSLDLTLLARHRHQLHQLEALLFGQAGLLAGKFTEAYPIMLKKEYLFLKKKYALKPVFAPVHFLRMRPVNFPTIRIAQLAMLLCSNEHLFSRLISTDDISGLRKMFEVTANDYWHYHYRFEETTAYLPKTLGSQMIDNIIINTAVPVVFAYGHYHKDGTARERALHWLDMMTPEKNRITNKFYGLGVRSVNAFDTQALYELKSSYCDERRCLECAVGNTLLKGELSAKSTVSGS
jgi:hypothetical protein